MRRFPRMDWCRPVDAKAPDLSILIVSFNTREYLTRCLAAIPQAAEDLTIETIVLDNGSTDGTQGMLAERFPQARLIQSQENMGFGRANNVGARAATGRALLLLNSDCELQARALVAMLRALDQDPSLGGVFCRLLNSDGSLQPSVHRSFPSPWSQLGDLFFLSSLRYAVYRNAASHPWLLRRTIRLHSQADDVAWGGAACMLIRRDVFEAVGGFDEGFFMYCEDMDLCKRIRGAGHRLHYLPNPSAVHHWGKSTAQQPATMLREAYRSWMYYFQKHFPGWQAGVARWITLGELSVRRHVLWLLAIFPSSHRRSIQERAAASAACLQDLRKGSFEGKHRAP
jgi:N-acetylglucosaminyl-diphospho-decaprenol L-rhamnosyltransferase